jgi:hypothetical protein
MQTSVSMNMPRARAGQLAHAFKSEDIRTMLAEGAVPFGHGVVEGTATRQGKVPSADTQVFAGFAALTQALESRTGSSAPGYADDEALNVCNWGAVWCQCTDTNLPSVNGSVYVVVGTGNAGKLTSSASGNINISTKVVVREVDSDLKLALVEFRERV